MSSATVQKHPALSELMPAHCCFFLQGRCAFPKCVYSHDPDALVLSCVYGAACKHKHWLLCQPAKDVIPPPPEGGQDLRINDFVGVWHSSFGDEVCVEPSKPGNAGGGPVQVILKRSGKEAKRLPFKSIGGGNFTCGHYRLDASASGKDRLVWLDTGETGWINVWDRVGSMPTVEVPTTELERRIQQVIAEHGEILVCQLGDKLGWREVKKEYGPLQGYLEQRPALFQIFNDKKTGASRVSLAPSGHASAPPGLELPTLLQPVGCTPSDCSLLSPSNHTPSHEQPWISELSLPDGVLPGMIHSHDDDKQSSLDGPIAPPPGLCEPAAAMKRSRHNKITADK